MDVDQFFGSEWPGVAHDLRRMLAKAGAPPREQDDLVQETAIRLLGMWDSIDDARPILPLARRIATNAWRDHWRRLGRREQLGCVPDRRSGTDTERAALARIEVGEVARALASLSPLTADTLRSAVRDSEGGGCMSTGPTPPAVRMARSRARRALVAQVDALPLGTTAA